MLARLAAALAAVAERVVPSAFAIAVLLTFVVVAAAAAFTTTSPRAILIAWGDGFWTLTPFAMQMSLVVLTGYLVSTAPIVDRLFARLAGAAGAPRRAAALMAAVSMGLAWVHWGLSLVGSAMFLRHVARAQPRVDYRLLVTAAYLGMGATWHAGLSGSVPLLMATPGHFLEATDRADPADRHHRSAASTSGSPLVVAVLMVAVVYALHPARGRRAVRAPADASSAAATARLSRPIRSVAEWCDHSRWLTAALGSAGRRLARGARHRWRPIRSPSMS